MKLKELYKHRTDFTIIGLTGRTGSGCTKIAELLSSDFDKIQKGLRENNDLIDPVFKRKYEICKNYLRYGSNWQKYDIIEYKKVLLIYIFKEIGVEKFKIRQLLLNNFKGSNDEDNQQIVITTLKKINSIIRENRLLIGQIRNLTEFNKIRTPNELMELNDIFFGKEFNKLASKIFETLEKVDYYKRTCLLHYVACNIRSSNNSISDDKHNPNNIYVIAEIINTIIKARKKYNSLDEKNVKSTKIVIDSLRNSLEIIFFKERYSAFYMVATKDILNNSIKRIDFRLKNKISNEDSRKNLVKKLIDLDETEYKTNDFSKGKFHSPDVENCIQKSDFHIFNLRKSQISTFTDQFEKLNDISKNEKQKLKDTFLTREEQLMKLIALISQPGLITPSASERNMQIAFTAKLNSGCISRQVGAVITDNRFYLKSLGWNDVAKGHTPCNLRNVEDFLNDNLEDNVHYSDFEKGKTTNLSEFKYKKTSPFNFKNAITEYFKESFDKNKSELNGKNCSFCFKTIHNYYEGESNQVHTRSLHAEENAMLQLTKFGGMGVEFGILFTTASPCELCSKKAYQLGIRFIYYIDPYPGIAVDQILSGGSNKPILIPFSGAIGNSYHKLYEPYLSPKDEITMSLEIKDKNIHINQFKNILKKISPNFKDIDKIKNIEDVQSILNQGLINFDNLDYELYDSESKGKINEK